MRGREIYRKEEREEREERGERRMGLSPIGEALTGEALTLSISESPFSRFWNFLSPNPTLSLLFSTSSLVISLL